jgi:hypothetical protein
MRLLNHTYRPELRKSISSFDSDSEELKEGEVRDISLKVVARQPKRV